MRRTRIRQVSKRRRQRDAVYQQRRREAFDRAEGRCEAWASPGCRGRGELTHHLAGRGGADPHAVEGLLVVCDPCHRHIHAHPAESYEQGWMVRRNGGAA